MASLKNIFLLSLLGLQPACRPTVEHHHVTPVIAEPASAPREYFESATALSHIALRSDSSQHFALYLPKAYDSSQTYPLIIFFDPQGAGEFPVKLYQELADRYAYILAGSQSCKNGLPMEQNLQMANKLYHELQERLPLKAENTVLCGHSGGAKLALMSAAANKQVRAVLYSGAAIPVQATHPFTCIGFAGLDDMNYTDLVSFDQSLENSGLPHYLMEWNGAHEFPAAKVFSQALDMLEKGLPAGGSKVSISIEKLQEEQKLKSYYLQAMQKEPISWWKTETAKLGQLKKKDRMYARLEGFISLLCYSMLSQAIQEKNWPAANHVLEVYKLADPKNTSIPGFEESLQKVGVR